MLERNFFFRYPGIGTVLHWRDTEMKNLLPTLPYYKRTNERTELHQFRKQLSYDGDVSPCQV